MQPTDADISKPAASQNVTPVALKTEAPSTDSPPLANAPATNCALQPDKTVKVPAFVSCLASEQRVSEAALKAINLEDSK
jgi:hypothetical protein